MCFLCGGSRELGVRSCENVEKEVADKRLSRRIAIYLTRKLTSKTLNEIANFYGKIGDTGISQICRRVESKRAEDKSFNKLIAKIEDRLNV